MRLRLPWAIVVASIGGCVAFCASLPWGEPCAVAGYSGQPCPILMSKSHEYLSNAAFLVICLLVGFVAGSMTSSRRYLAGILSTPLSVILAVIVVHVIYPVDTPLFNSAVPGVYTTALVFFVCLALLGLLGAAASRWSPNNRWRGP
jgi:hypothetical protein